MKRCAKTPDLRISRAELLVRISLCLFFALQIYPAISFSQQITRVGYIIPGSTANSYGPCLVVDKQANNCIEAATKVKMKL